MKKELILSIGILMFSLSSCKKSEEGNKGIIKADSANTEILADNGAIDSTIAYNTDINGKKSIKTDYVYKATDKSLVKVVFNYDPKNRTVSITNNNKTFVLEKSEAKVNETIYKKDDMTATVKGDSLIIHQGNNIIELERTKI
ncbi:MULTISPECIES: hypothetical protein [Chryseobacterium]|uniref:hypothetical protein n=1 Tax=Chryseobacterium TaxID=59732 RepID=UPI000E24318D|nr:MULTISPECIES: hypothetical protein [Chryseobacterium]MBM7417735.1 hypothetical protein [Chryseobacterium sp. JUb44]MDH6211928.1 hypothetical protein [Chryseobacterium sp. BIGb0186]REC44992.1 hypothetical protein DRF69_03760 [Chryseobacterium sp. 5_R23647]WSO10560.1 hypothetical protein VUJ64_01270 [Chryseobacterium scophthalmum]